jgi:hypothetical protein
VTRDFEVLQEKALETAQRMLDYGSYDRKRTKALSALRRKAPGYQAADYERWLDEAVSVHADDVAYTKANSERLLSIYDTKREHLGFQGHISDFLEQHPRFTAKQLYSEVAFVFYLCCLR